MRPTGMTSAVVKKWKRRMEMMNEYVNQETRKMSLEDKLLATAQLMRVALARKETPLERRALAGARRNWHRLREALNGRGKSSRTR